MDINDKLLKIIKERIPEGYTQSTYLSDILDIGYDSAIRRLNGQVKLTIEDIAILADHLNISLDNLIGIQKQQKAPFKLQLLENDDLLYTFKKKIEDLTLDIKRTRAENGSIEGYLAMNKLNISMILSYNLLSKFLVYRWLHQMEGINTRTKMKDFIIPQDIIEAQKKYIQEVNKIDKVTIIFEKDVYSSIVYNINKFYNKGLVSTDECNILKQELLESINSIDNTAKSVAESDTRKINLYISKINIDTSYTLYKSSNSNIKTSQFSVYSIHTLDSSDNTVCQYQENWFDSLKRFSIKISGCSEFEREDFLSNQRKIVDMIGTTNCECSI